MGDRKYLNLCNFYFLLWCTYLLQGVVYSSGGLLSQLLLLLILGVSLVGFVICLFSYKLPSYLKGLAILLLMFTFYGIILLFSSDSLLKSSGETVSKISYLKGVYSSLLPVYSFYWFSKRKLLTIEKLRFWIVISFIVVTANFLRHRAAIMVRLDAEEITNNIGYWFLALIPTCVLFKNKPLIQYGLLLYALCFILLGMKRGAIVIGFICAIVFILYGFKKSSRTKKFLTILLSVATVISVYYLFQYLLQNSDYFNYRLNSTIEGNTSQRDVLFSTLMDYYRSTTPLKQLFGSGAYSTILIGGNAAHNDWLELLVCTGLLGVFIYLIYWFGFINSVKKLRANSHYSDYYLAGVLILLIYFLMTLFSMSYSEMQFYTTAVLGFIISEE